MLDEPPKVLASQVNQQSRAAGRQVGGFLIPSINTIFGNIPGAISHCALQVTLAIATGPKPPATFGNTNDETPSSLKLSLGGGPGPFADNPEPGTGMTY